MNCARCNAGLTWADLKNFKLVFTPSDHARFGGYLCISCAKKEMERHD